MAYNQIKAYMLKKQWYNKHPIMDTRSQSRFEPLQRSQK
jgi:hypothetical protein